VVYGDYTQAELDRQYDQTSLVPNIAIYTGDWLARSAATRERIDCGLDQAYGMHPREKLDVFPASHPAAPAFLIFHGGAWRGLSKNHFSMVAAPLVAAGITAVVVGFGLVPTVSLDVQIHQARAAVSWVSQRSAVLSIDPSRIFVAGHSSGGHIAVLMATTDWTVWQLPADTVKGAVSVSGIYDMEPVRLSSRNAYLHLSDQGAHRNSAIAQLDSRTFKPSLVIAWAANELDEFRRQGRTFATASQDAGWPTVALQLEKHNHFSAVEAMTDSDGPIARQMIEMVCRTPSTRRCG